MLAMKTRTRPYEVTEYFRDGADMAAHLEAALEDGHPAVVATALGDVARAVGMTRVARLTGLGRESLYKALSADGNPEFATVLRVIAALGMRLTVAAVEPVPPAPGGQRSARRLSPVPDRAKLRPVPEPRPTERRGSVRKSRASGGGRPR
jgi:probable addiction module antidote protein